MRSFKPLGVKKTAFAAGVLLLIGAALLTFISPIRSGVNPRSQTEGTNSQGAPNSDSNQQGWNLTGWKPESVVDRYALVLALATFGLFISTTGLWIFTRRAIQGEEKAARAAALHARAVVALQLPILRADPAHPKTPDDTPISGERQFIRDCLVVGITFRNDGMTTAAPLSLRHGWCVIDTLPALPVYTRRRQLRPTEAIPPGGKRYFPIQGDITMNKEDATRTLTETAHFWLYAAVEFFDFMDVRRETRFCWRWEGRETTSDGTEFFTSAYGFGTPPDVPEAYTWKSRECGNGDG